MGVIYFPKLLYLNIYKPKPTLFSMVLANQTAVTLYQVIEGGILLNQASIITLIIFCIGAAIGTQWGLDRLYDNELLTKFKAYRKELVSNLKFKLREIALNTRRTEDEFNKEINKFIEEWQEFQENVNNYYESILRWRKTSMIFFFATALLYLIRLSRPDLFVYSYSIVFISNLLLLVSLISLMMLFYKIFSLNSRISKYLLKKPEASETLLKIQNRIFSKKER